MFYERKIKYFNYMENGERVRGAGFVRLEVRDGICYLALQVNNLGVSNYSKPVFLVGGGRECRLCELQVRQGMGTMQFQLPRDNLCGGISYSELSAIRMPIDAGKEVYCEIQKQVQSVTGAEPESGTTLEAEELPTARRVSPSDEAEVTETDVENFTGQEVRAWNTIVQESGAQNTEVPESEVPVTEVPESEVPESEVPESEVPEIKIQNATVREVTIQNKAGAEEKKQSSSFGDKKVALRENKWKQLCEIYRHITPFQDERDYLSIGPGDFVIFPEKYYGLVNNSFLLHGYYNYKHLILTRMTVRGETRYYMGVPGNFYEREKQVALMFGFESFECREEPARAGDYGYYMIRVEL